MAGYIATLTRGNSHTHSDGRRFVKGRPVNVDEDLAEELRATGRFDIRRAPKAAQRQAPTGRAGAGGKHPSDWDLLKERAEALGIRWTGVKKEDLRAAVEAAEADAAGGGAADQNGGNND